MNTYACLKRQHFEHQGYALLPVQPEHIEPIRLWRNAQMDVLRQSAPITAEQQLAYFDRHIWPTQALAQPANLLLALLHEGRLIGYGGLVHIAWEHRRAEVSFLLDAARIHSEAQYAADFSAFLSLLATVAFDDLGFRRLFTETYAMRLHHIAVLQANQFDLEGVLRQHVLIDGRPVDSLMHGRLANS
jgi:RimJ/RimL family protein N-acetyltransferase